MTTLGVETSSLRGGVALWGTDRPTSLLMDTPLHHAEELLDLTARLLDQSGVTRAEIDRVSVNQGPGSFTGLRIGIATAKGLCQSLRIPLVGVDGTIACRAGLDDAAARACVILNNRRDVYYVRWFVGMRPQGPVEVLTRDAVVDRLRTDARTVWAIGEGANALREALLPLSGVRFAPDETNTLSPLAIARLGEEQSCKDALFELEPVYVEPALHRTRRQR